MSRPVSADGAASPGGEPDAATGLSGRRLLLLGLTCAVCVANNYYSQPLLIQIARDLGMSKTISGLAPTLTQVGIATGMLLLLPLGDRIDNRRIVVTLLLVQAVALAAMCSTTNAPLFLVGALCAGVCGIVTYLLPAYATRLTPAERRGAVTGALATGIMIGIMLGRSLAGIAGYAVGWRVVFGCAAAVTLLMALVMRRAMPRTPGLRPEAYSDLLASLVRLAWEVPLLRRAAFVQALSFGTFNALWIGLAIRLQGDPFDLDTREIGELALVAITGALGAPVIGRLADRFDVSVSVRLSLLMIALGWASMLIFPAGYVGVVAAMVLVGVGATGTDVALRSALYGLAPTIRMRLNSVYSFGTFAGGSLFSLMTPIVLVHQGWPTVCAASVAASLIGLVMSPPAQRAAIATSDPS